MDTKRSFNNIISKFCRMMILPFLLLAGSCTDLTESLRNEVPAEGFFKSDKEFISALGDAYGPMANYGTNSHITSINEVASDAVVVAQKGPDWEDGGIWIRLHRHTYRPSDDKIENTWNQLFGGVNAANRLIFQFESLVESGAVDPAAAEAFFAELRALRAFYYYLLLDNFGNVPIVTSFADTDLPFQPSADFAEGRRALFNFVETELLESLNAVDSSVSETIGRVNRWVVHMTLAKLYLNAEVYTGTPRWSDVVTHTDAIINSGHYALTANYFDNFAADNDFTPEHIFIIPFDQALRGGFNLHMMTNHILSQPAFNFANQPWNGYQTVAEFYGSYIDSEQNPGPQGDVIGLDPEGTTVTGTLDQRLGNFLVGFLRDLQGNIIEDPGAFASETHGKQVFHTPYINELAPLSWRQGGARIAKYEMEIGLTSTDMNNNMVVYRYADVLLMKAEALWRMNAGDGTALLLVNQVRERAGVDPFASLNADNLLAERGREFFYEVIRRQDLIRFQGKSGGTTRYNDPWWEKQVSDASRNVFPIPQAQLEANTNLIQNPGY